MKNFNYFALLLAAIIFTCMMAISSCTDANASTQQERIEASTANDVHQAELQAVIDNQPDLSINEATSLLNAQKSNCIASLEDENPIIGTIEISNKTYEVHEGPRGGQYVWRIRTRDTSAGLKGSCYKQGLGKDQKLLVKRN